MESVNDSEIPNAYTGLSFFFFADKEQTQSTNKMVRTSLASSYLSH